MRANTYRGACERGVDRMIADRTRTIEINWSSMSAKETGSGGADRITRKLIEAGYRPEGSRCPARYREAYEAGRKVDGRYIRLPQETWERRDEPMNKMCGETYVVDRVTGDLVYMLVYQGDCVVREYADGHIGSADEQDLIIMERRSDLEKTG